MVLQLCKEFPGRERGEKNVKAWRWVGGITPFHAPNWQLLEVGDVIIS